MTDDDLATVASTTGSRIVICVVGFTAVTAISDSHNWHERERAAVPR